MTNKIEYRPEFLYFNRFVREKLYEPWTHKWIWAAGPKPSLFQVLDFLLFHGTEQPAGGSRAALARLWRALQCPGFPEDVDEAGWREYAGSLRIEAMLDKYLPRIFRALGDTYWVPPIKISPVRLVDCPKNHFRALLNGTFSAYHVTYADPPHYNIVDRAIYLPIPEKATRLPPLLLDWWLLHEILHAATWPLLLGEGAVIRGIPVQIPAGWRARVFGEMFAEVGAWAILDASGLVPRRDRLSVLMPHLKDSRLFAAAFGRMWAVGLPGLCALLAPVFQMARRIDFCLQEVGRIKALSAKRSRGILVKKYQSKKRIAGMDPEDMKAMLSDREFTRLRAVLRNVESLDIFKLLLGAADAREAGKERDNLSALAGLFGKGREEQWRSVDMVRE